MIWQDTAQSSIRPDRTRQRILLYAGLAAGLFALSLAARTVSWRGGAHLHVVTETVAAVLALTTGVLALSRHYSRNNATLFLIGTAFLVTGLLDGFDAAVTAADHAHPQIPGAESMFPWSELASPLFLSILLAWSWIAWVRERKTGRPVVVPQKLGYLGVTLATLASIAFVALVLRPTGYGASSGLPQPEELLPAGPFLVALAGYWSKGRWQRDPFEAWLVAALIVAVSIHTLFTPFSRDPADALAQTAHLLKLVSYELVLFGAVVSMNGLFRKVEDGAHEIARANVALQEEVAERMRAERALTEGRVRLELLHTVSRDVHARMTTDEIIRHAVRALHDHFADFRAAYCRLAPTGELHVSHAVAPPGMRDHVGLRSDISVAPEYLDALSSGEPFLCDDVSVDPRLAPIREELQASQCLAIATWPLRHSTGPRGLICLDSPTPHTWSLHEQRSLEDLADYLASVLNEARAEAARREVEKALLEKARDLERSNSELEQFAYVASHDLQEPLRMVAGYTQLLARRYRGQLDEEADRFIEYAVDGVTRMQRLIQDLLAYSRVDTYEADFRPVAMEDALEWALLNLESSIEDAGATITHEGLPAVSGDRTQLGQLLQNLIGNAIKFRGEDAPEIIVRATRRGREWVFEVRDNGIGIEPDHRDRVFEIFQRLHPSSAYEGTGIGLAVSKRIVERHGGRIWVESTPGAGSSFFFTVPVISVEAAA